VPRAARAHASPTLAAPRWSLTLPLSLTRTLADLRWTGGPLTHVGQPREHGAQTVEANVITAMSVGNGSVQHLWWPR
jgi:hypothetical protein